ncbi:MAG TPA: DUF4190 domain-containing protein [Solirubrobacter sp.]|jgi:hypothetical protein|nr:DUF4190 domain-containing protein [Solirubrobacter sp.]
MSFEQPGPYYQGPPPQGTSGEATASLILGICGLLICSLICSPLAIMYGKRAQRSIAASGGRLGGDGQASAGIILGWIGIGLLALGVAIAVIVVIAAVATA